MNVWLNGELADTRGATNVAELAEKFRLAAHTVLIEHNGTALHQREWLGCRLEEADRLEFVRIVAGG